MAFDKRSYDAEYNRQNYSRVSVIVKKGDLEKYRAAIAGTGLSLSAAFLVAFTEKYMIK